MKKVDIEWIFATPIHMLKPDFECDAIRRLGLWEVISHDSGDLMNEISVLIKVVISF